MTPTFAFDVFISYSSKDKAWVRGELLTRLEQAGLKVCVDFRDFKPGKSALLNMPDAVRHSRRSLLVISPNWFTSEWTLFEGVLGRHRSPSGRETQTIPLLRERCEFPDDADFIAALTYIDFTDGADLDLAWRQLLTALGAAPELPPPKEPEHPHWYLAHPYPMPPNFTGRVSERGTLTRWLNEDAAHPLLVLRALGGFGKSALAWHWLTHDVDAKQWPRVVWWSFYEGDASFDHFVEETLVYLCGEQIKAQPLSAREQFVALLKGLHQSGTLLVLDGFERVLRAFSGLEAAYQGDEGRADLPVGQAARQRRPTDDNDRDCVSPLADDFLHNLALQPQLRSKVLLTTRLCPRIVEAKGGGQLQGCREVPLLQMQPEDAVAFFHAQGIRGTHTEIELACEPYGYHPLRLRLLAGLIIGDFQQPGDIAAAKRLDVSGDLVQRQHHVLEQVYDSLAPARRKLLGAIACFRWPVSYDTLKAVAGEGETAETRNRRDEAPASISQRLSASAVNLDANLRDLVGRGLLHHDAREGRFDLHPIVRHYAYDRLAAPERAAAHTRLRDYFAAVPWQKKVTRLEGLAPVIELYHHTVRAGQFDEALTLFRDRLHNPLYYQLGAYPLISDLLHALFPDGEDRPPRLKNESAQAWALNSLANSYGFSGQPRRAAPLFEKQIAIREKQGDKSNLAIGLGNVAIQQLVGGALRAAEANLHRSIALDRELKDEFAEACDRQELGRLLACRGEDAESETELGAALKMFEKRNEVQSQGVNWAYRAQRELLWLRLRPIFRTPRPNSALAAARRALELADEDARTDYPVVRDYVSAHWLLGAAHRVARQHDEAERHLHEALERCRRINLVDHEADILIDLARLRAATASTHSTSSGQAPVLDEAQRLAEEARVIAERSGYVLQGADAHLELAKLALGFYAVGQSCGSAGRSVSVAPPEAGASFSRVLSEAVRSASLNQRKLALHHAQEASRLATCDGPPDHTYKAAYDEATTLLQQLA